MSEKNEERLILLAAKAAGLKVQYSNNYGDFSIGEPYSKGETRWNPIEDDGDALRLLAVIARHAAFRFSAGKTIHGNNILLDLETSAPKTVQVASLDSGEGDVAKSMRRIIVSAAAEIGKKM